MYPKISAIKEELFTDLGYKDINSFLFGNHTYSLFTQIINHTILNESSGIRSSGNRMATGLVGDHITNIYFDIISDAIFQAEQEILDNKKLHEVLDCDIKIHTIAGILLRNHNKSELNPFDKEFSINLGLSLYKGFGYLTTKEAEDLKLKLYHAAELTVEEEKPTYDYNLKYIYALAFGREKAQEQLSFNP